ncbi:hypothetical protein N9W71_02705 [Planktomarina temperata]|jgi:hypothetical protein|nr:hypothetical protein [Planktomarina temperata]
MLLTQQCLARAAREFRRRSSFHRTSHSNEQKRVEIKLTFSGTLPKLERRGPKQSLTIIQQMAGFGVFQPASHSNPQQCMGTDQTADCRVIYPVALLIA